MKLKTISLQLTNYIAELGETEYDDNIYHTMSALGDAGDFIGGQYTELMEAEPVDSVKRLLSKQANLIKKLFNI